MFIRFEISISVFIIKTEDFLRGAVFTKTTRGVFRRTWVNYLCDTICIILLRDPRTASVDSGPIWSEIFRNFLVLVPLGPRFSKMFSSWSDLVQGFLNPYWQIMENSSRNFSQICIFRVVTQPVLLENSSIRIF